MSEYEQWAEFLKEYDDTSEELDDASRDDWYDTFKEYYEDEWPDNV